MIVSSHKVIAGGECTDNISGVETQFLGTVPTGNECVFTYQITGPKISDVTDIHYVLDKDVKLGIQDSAVSIYLPGEGLPDGSHQYILSEQIVRDTSNSVNGVITNVIKASSCNTQLGAMHINGTKSRCMGVQHYIPAPGLSAYASSNPYTILSIFGECYQIPNDPATGCPIEGEPPCKCDDSNDCLSATQIQASASGVPLGPLVHVSEPGANSCLKANTVSIGPNSCTCVQVGGTSYCSVCR